MPAPDDAHYGTVANLLATERVVPFFGAGVHGRPPNRPFRPHQDLPSGSELAEYLYRYICEQHRHTLDERYREDLVRMSQYVAVMMGNGPLYNMLHGLFARPYPITPLHRLFADLAHATARRDGAPRPSIIVTTNYDDVMEEAYREAEVPFDTLTYLAEGIGQQKSDKGKFLFRTYEDHEHDHRGTVVHTPNEFAGFKLGGQGRPLVIKIHGAAHRGADTSDFSEDSYVVTEDDYIHFLMQSDVVPAPVMAELLKSHFLFLGYGLRDWNLRVILERIWGDQRLSYESWAVQKDPTKLDTKFWMRRGVEIVEADVQEYAQTLRQHIGARLPLEQRAGPALQHSAPR